MILQDSRLTWEERGMLCDLLSRPEDFDVNVSGLAKLGNRSRDKVYALLKKPIELGYVVKVDGAKTGAGGRFDAITYEVYSLPREVREQIKPVLDTVSETSTRKEAHRIENADTHRVESTVTVKSTQQKNDRNKGIKEKEYTAQQAARSVSFDEFWSSLPSPMKKGKALARKHWEKLSQVQRKAAKDGLASYLKTGEPKRGYFKHGSTYLSERVWEDYEGAQTTPAVDSAKERRIQIKSVALDKGNGTWTHSAPWFKSSADVPADIMAAADRYLASGFEDATAPAA
jgi:hypothetical protein